MEAKPIVTRLGLTAEPGLPYSVYRDDRTVLLVTGVGTLKASAAVGWAFGQFPGIKVALNVGFCGAAPGAFSLHEWVYVSSIRDKATGRLHVPDILLEHPFAEAALLTVPHVVKTVIDWNGVVDMEGSGFFEAASKFLPPDRLALLKWVSDPLTGSIHLEETSNDYMNSIQPALEFIREWPLPCISENKAGSNGLADEVELRLRLTRTQTHYIRKWASGFIARGGDPDTVLKQLPEAVPPTKEGNTRVFERLKDVFKN